MGFEVGCVWPPFRDVLENDKSYTPGVMLFDNILIKYRNIDKMLTKLEKFSDNKKCDFDRSTAIISKGNCKYCGSVDDLLLFRETFLSVCPECCAKGAKGLRKIQDEILWYGNGVFIKDINGHDEKPDCSFEVKNKDIIIALGFRGSRRVLFYKLSNFYKLINNIKNNIGRDYSSSGGFCSSCGMLIKSREDSSSLYQSDRKSDFHNECLENIISELEEFQEENPDLVVSRCL